MFSASDLSFIDDIFSTKNSSSASSRPPISERALNSFEKFWCWPKASGLKDLSSWGGKLNLLRFSKIYWMSSKAYYCIMWVSLSLLRTSTSRASSFFASLSFLRIILFSLAIFASFYVISLFCLDKFIASFFILWASAIISFSNLFSWAQLIYF